MTCHYKAVFLTSFNSLAQGLLHDHKNSSKRCEFLRFYLYLCHANADFCLISNRNTKLSEKSGMAKS